MRCIARQARAEDMIAKNSEATDEEVVVVLQTEYELSDHRACLLRTATKGARAPMQFMPGTAARYGLLDPHNLERAIDAAARYSVIF